MRRAILSPTSKPLTHEVQWDRQPGKKYRQRSVCHDRRDVPRVDNPIVEEPGHTICPQILDHCGGDKDLASYRLVAVDLVSQVSVCGSWVRSGDFGERIGTLTAYVSDIADRAGITRPRRL